MLHEWRQGEFLITTDQDKLDLDLLHNFLAEESYWATGRSREVVERSVKNSVSFGVFKHEEMIGFGRVVTDYATFAWIADVFILQEHRGTGLAKWLIEVILSHPELQGFRRWVLSTKDAHGLYQRFGFRELKRPERWLERPDPAMRESPDYWQDTDTDIEINASEGATKDVKE